MGKNEAIPVVTHPFAVVDAFTDRPFAGNPAAVMVLESWPEDAWMALVAREMNLSETAFVVPMADGGFHIRWFTPTVEVALCGHATLATAHHMWEERSGDEILFHSQSGRLAARRLADGWIRLDFPGTFAEAVEAPPGLLEALGLNAAVWIGRSKFDYLVQVAAEDTVRSLSPDHTRLKSLPVRGVMVTAAGRDYDFVSRFFAPGAGVPEDPVTGSAHCALAPFWASRLGKERMTAYQASSRGGIVRVEFKGERVYLEGQAVTVSRGNLLV